MGIMDKMRAKMGIIMIILIAAFVITIVFNWGAGGIGTFMKDGNVVGVVNGEKITIKSFYETYNSALEQYRNAGIELDARMTESILQQTWETVVSQILWEQEIDRLGITVSDEELYHHLEANPPEFLKTQEAFLTDGAFDYSKYLNILKNPQGNEWLEIENYLRSSVLPYQKLNDIIISSVIVDENEILQKFSDQSQIYSVNYLSAPVRLLPDSLFTIYDEDIRANYEENKEELYKKEERRNIRYVYWLKVPSANDSAVVLDDLKDIILRESEGESFDDLAQIFSETQVDGDCGDMGWFAKDELRPEYQNAVFSANVGDILDPILIGTEYHLIKVKDKKVEKGVEQVHISLLIRSIDPLNTYDYYSTEAEAFVLDVESYGFAKAFDNIDAELDTMRGGFTKEFPYFGNLGYLPALAKWAYRSKIGDLSPVYENETAIVVAELIGIDEASYIPLEDVKSSVEHSVIAELKIEKSAELIKEAYASFMRGDITLLDVSNNNAFLEYKSFSSTVEELPYPFGSSPAFADVIRHMGVNTISAPFLNDNYGYVFVQLTARTAIDEDLYAQKHDELQQSLLAEKQKLTYESWMKNLKDKAEIKDYRVKFGLN
ncbi:MAG: SurA N-terminal domain-containing protein [Candidatus Marinimicrobia bacterium]|nr:SurA N-terminal domain-containing protein [Candidatus Neomarinimicrobiota bacterium]